MSSLYQNSYIHTPRPPVLPTDELHENTPTEEYDLNSIIPPPAAPLKTKLVSLQPLIPSLHAESLYQAFSTHPTDADGDVYFYPYPKGKPQQSKTETLVFLEGSRRRPNSLLFAITDLASGDFAGTMALGCDPTQATLDVKMLTVKIVPKFRSSYVFKHASYLLISYVLNPKSEGGLGLVRLGWRTPPANVRSQKAAEKLGFAKEGVMRCYGVTQDIGDETAYTDFRPVPDNTGRVTIDGVVYSMTCYDWLSDKKREALGDRL